MASQTCMTFFGGTKIFCFNLFFPSKEYKYAQVNVIHYNANIG